MEKFTEIKQEILRRAKGAHACVEQYKRALESENLQQLAQVIKDNFVWCCRNKVLDVEFIELHETEFASVEIYANKSTSSGYVVIDGNVDILGGTAVAYMIANSTVNEMWGNSTVTEMRGNSTVTEMRGNSTVTKMWENSTVNEMWGNSTVTEMRGNSTVTEMRGNSTVTEMRENSTVTKMWENSTVNEMWGNSTVTEMRGNSYISTYNYIECKIRGNAIMRVINEKKIYTNTEVEKPKS